MDDSYRNLCIFHVLDGLREGLSHFSQTSRAALVYATTPDSPVRVYDPQDLLQGHEPALAKAFFGSNEWKTPPAGTASLIEQTKLAPLHLSGLISHSSCSRTIAHQSWFTEHHPDMCSTGPTERWLEHAAWLLSQNFASDNVLYIETSGNVLQNWAQHAVRNCIVDARSAEIGMDTRLRIYPILDSILSISKMPEEGKWPRGRLVFVEPSQLTKVNFLVRFPEQEAPRIESTKHVRKLLQSVENSWRVLVSDGQTIVGVAAGAMPTSRIEADYRGSYGFLKLDDKPICSFYEGGFHSSTRKANLVHLEETLIESNLDTNSRSNLLRIITSIVQAAQSQKHGCSLVIDFGEEATTLAGMHLDEPIDLCDSQLLELAQNFSRVDGALHIGSDCKLHGFGCLLDGRAVWAEDRSRGARYNSALRFTAENDDLVVVVVSSDRPVSIFQHGVELTATCLLPPQLACVDTPPLLEDWVEG